MKNSMTAKNYDKLYDMLVNMYRMRFDDSLECCSTKRTVEGRMWAKEQMRKMCKELEITTIK